MGTGVKWPGLKTDHLLPYSTEVKNYMELLHGVKSYNATSLKQ
jgi:hypothetical protein